MMVWSVLDVSLSILGIKVSNSMLHPVHIMPSNRFRIREGFVSRSSLLSIVIIEKVRIGIAQQALFESSLIEKVSQARDTQCITPLLRLPP
jgi:hypothetical protein